MKKVSKSARKSKPAAKAKAKQPKTTKQPAAKQAAPKAEKGSLYRGMYGALYAEASKGFAKRDEVIARVAKATGKSEECVGFAYQVLRSPKHQSNKSRSTEVRQGELVKLVPVTKA